MSVANAANDVINVQRSLIQGTSGSGSSWSAGAAITVNGSGVLTDGGNTISSPMIPFVDDPMAADYLQLVAGSPAIDAGANGVLTDIDLDNDGTIDLSITKDAAGNPRRQGNRVDLGPFEREWRLCKHACDDLKVCPRGVNCAA